MSRFSSHDAFAIARVYEDDGVTTEFFDRVVTDLSSGDALKRCLDIAAASFALLAFAPLFLVIAALLSIEGGGVFYGHWRVGRYGTSFPCLKFRTMVPHADQVLRRLLQADEMALAEWNRDFKLRRDPRITPLGRFLRRSSLDELPQLINVLRGDMSLVGPRPIVREEIPRYGEHIRHYFLSRPGITGLWQISGRNDIGYAGRIALDMLYAKKRSLRGDIVILVKTVKVVLTHHGAY